MKTLKQLEGQLVFLIPTGNNARYFIKKELFKVSRVSLILANENGDYEQKFRYENNHISNNCNAGYQVYETESDFNDQVELERLSDLLSQQLRYSKDLQKLGLNKLEAIKAILDES